MRKLASIRKISEIREIPNADFICAYKVDGWWVVDSKNKYQVGDRVIYFEIDSFLPIEPQYEFLRKSSYKKLLNGTEGFRLRTIKLRGVISQGLIMPCTIEGNIGDDVSEALNVTKYEPPIPFELIGDVEGAMPSSIPKTDEERIQNVDPYFCLSEKQFFVTEKLEGTSFTVFVENNKVGVCGRNWSYKFNPGNSFWKFVYENDLETKLINLKKNIALQGEFIGPGIQGNIYKLNKLTVKFFTCYDIDNNRRMNFEELKTITDALGIETVPIVNPSLQLPKEDVIDYLLEYSQGKSLLNNSTEREGIVIRWVNDPNISYKVINNKYLLKQD